MTRSPQSRESPDTAKAQGSRGGGVGVAGWIAARTAAASAAERIDGESIPRRYDSREARRLDRPPARGVASRSCRRPFREGETRERSAEEAAPPPPDRRRSAGERSAPGRSP